MNLAACGGLPRFPETGTWYRAIGPSFLPSALSSVHTTTARSRFSGGPLLPPWRRFEILYFADDPVVAAFECGALFGSLSGPGGYLPNPRRGFVSLNVQVVLHELVDLADVPGAQAPLDTTAQELTGDWDGYQVRDPSLPTPVTAPRGLAPTQELGEALI